MDRNTGHTHVTDLPFWKTKKLSQMSEAEWESLCDGCGKCCLIKIEWEEDNQIDYTNLRCRLLDDKTCLCKDYENRKQHVPDCVKLTPRKLGKINWLPPSCGYRLVHEGKDLPDWHHLICGDKARIHREGRSVQGRTLIETSVAVDDQEDFIVDWEAGFDENFKAR